jgi:hypothetical protein
MTKLLRIRLFEVSAVALISIGASCASTKDVSVQSEIMRYKQMQVDQLLRNKSQRDCLVDSLFFPHDYVATFSDSLGKSQPTRIAGLTQYILRVDSSQSIEDVTERLIQLGKKTDNLSSFILKDRLQKTSGELRTYVKRLAQLHDGELRTIDFDKLIFENYQSCEPSSEAKLLDDHYVIFLNDRLLDLCSWMSDLVYRLTIPVDSSGNYVRFPQNEEEASDKIKFARPRLVELVYHYLYDCPLRFTIPSSSAFAFTDYMELFVLAHEYAHADFDHLLYQEAYGDTMSLNEKREIALNRWMNEIQADVFALNVARAKYYERIHTNDNSLLMTAGAFYLTCIEILERSRLIIESNSADADEKAKEEYKIFRELIRRIDPFPLTFTGARQYRVDATAKDLIDSLVDLRNPPNLLIHPPAIARADILLNSLKVAAKSREELSSLEVGISMCQALLNVFELSKEELCKQ